MNSSPLSDRIREFALDELRGLGYFSSIEWVDCIDSTNKALIQRVREQRAELPALLISDKQTSGVGRGSHQWWSPSGCLMFSMAIPLSYSHRAEADTLTGRTTDSCLLPLRVGCAIAKALRPLARVKPSVKWPNDVYMEGKKVCGVLIETIPSFDTRTYVSVIGIGINCQVDFASAPAELRLTATSLHEWSISKTAESTTPEHVLVQFLHQWLQDESAQRESLEVFLNDWPMLSLLDGQWVEVKHGAQISQGLCLGISPQGALRIQDEQLQVIEILAGTVVSFRSLRD